MEEILYFAQEKKLQAQYLVKDEKWWPGLRGEVDQYVLGDHMPPDGEDTLIMICGSNKFKFRIEDVLVNELNYSRECIYLV